MRVSSERVNMPLSEKERFEIYLDLIPFYRSFWTGGGDSSTPEQLSPDGIPERMNCAEILGHEAQIDSDYEQLAKLGIFGVRENACLFKAKKLDTSGRKYDFSYINPVLEASKKNGVDIMWSLSHYDYPEDMYILDEMFPEEFSDMGVQFMKHLQKQDAYPRLMFPINEPSYFAWAAGDGNAAWAPYMKNKGDYIKRNLVSAFIMFRIKMEDAGLPPIIYGLTDPIYFMHPAKDCEHDQEVVNFANGITNASSEVTKTLADCKAINLVGVNLYRSGQREAFRDSHGCIQDRELTPDDPRRLPVAEVLNHMWDKYHLPLFISETSIDDPDREAWLEEVGDGIRKSLRSGVPILGADWYPTWGFAGWHRRHEVKSKYELPIYQSGIFNTVRKEDGSVEHILVPSMAEGIQRQEQLIMNEVNHLRAQRECNVADTIFDRRKHEILLPLAA